jgi:hypothetical protein
VSASASKILYHQTSEETAARLQADYQSLVETSGYVAKGIRLAEAPANTGTDVLLEVAVKLGNTDTVDSFNNLTYAGLVSRQYDSASCRDVNGNQTWLIFNLHQVEAIRVVRGQDRTQTGTQEQTVHTGTAPADRLTPMLESV